VPPRRIAPTELSISLATGEIGSDEGVVPPMKGIVNPRTVGNAMKAIGHARLYGTEGVLYPLQAPDWRCENGTTENL